MKYFIFLLTIVSVSCAPRMVIDNFNTIGEDHFYLPIPRNELPASLGKKYRIAENNHPDIGTIWIKDKYGMVFTDYNNDSLFDEIKVYYDLNKNIARTRLIPKKPYKGEIYLNLDSRIHPNLSRYNFIKETQTQRNINYKGEQGKLERLMFYSDKYTNPKDHSTISYSVGEADALDQINPTMANLIGNILANDSVSRIFEKTIFPSLEGKSSLGDKVLSRELFENKITVFNFWFAGCKPCIEEIPDLNAIRDRFGPKGDIVFVAVTLDKENIAREALRKYNFNYDYHIYDGNSLTKSLSVNSFPAHFVLDKSGKIVYQTRGGGGETIKKIESSIELAYAQ